MNDTARKKIDTLVPIADEKEEEWKRMEENGRDYMSFRSYSILYLTVCRSI
jgi:hypothetical protein